VTSADPRPPLTRERVLDAAIEMADANGVGALSMRKLAKNLGFEVMSLYNHVANKDDLLDAMVDRVASEIVTPVPGADWKADARAIAISAHEALLRHRWASALWSTRWPGPNQWRYMERLLAALADAELPDDLADLGFHAITLHIAGFTQQQVSYTMSDEQSDEMYARFAREVTADEFPLVIDHVRYHRDVDEHPKQPRDEFAFVLDLILDGLARAAQ
jgi:AcrR family transcriptional regulator